MRSSEWKVEDLGDVASYLSEKVNLQEINLHNYVSTENLLTDFGGVDTASSLPTVNKVNKYQKGNILVSNIRPYFKKIWLANRNGGCSNDVLVIKANDNVDNSYLYYNLANDKFFNYVMSGAKGTKMPRGDKQHILGYKMFLPSLKEQKAIAHILSTLDEKIEVNNQINKTLEDMAQTIFKHWFVDFEFPNENGEPYKSSGSEMIESEFGMIPKGWEVTNLGKIADITMGQSPKGTSYNEIGIGEVFYQGRTDFDKRFPLRRLYTTEPKRMALKGDILMSVRAPVGDINIAYENCCIGRGLCSIRHKNNYSSYMYYLMLSLKEKLNVYNGEGTVFGSINKDALSHLTIINSTDFLINKFNTLVKSFDLRYLSLVNENRQLTKLRDTLLPKLMSGEIRVPLDQEGEVS